LAVSYAWGVIGIVRFFGRWGRGLVVVLAAGCGQDEVLPAWVNATAVPSSGAAPFGPNPPAASDVGDGGLADSTRAELGESAADLPAGCVDADLDGARVGCALDAAEDCDDEDPSVAPGFLEICDQRDNDCDGLSDEELDQTFYLDVDQDGAGTTQQTLTGCEAPLGYSAVLGDCDDEDPDNAGSCGSCVDADVDGAFTGCDRYITRVGPDCDDTDADTQTSCNSCADRDRDGAYWGCERYDVHPGPDCDDDDPDNQVLCASCIDRDTDGSFVGCDKYVERGGPDCDDGDPDNRVNCTRCLDLDGDGSFAGCDVYIERVGPDCDDSDTDNALGCMRCIDRDGDGVFVGCDRYDRRNGPDCDDLDAAETRECRSCVDADGDGYYATCDFIGARGPDCNDQDTDNFGACTRCVDLDADGSFSGCDRFVERQGPDCDDNDTDNVAACARCLDADDDGYFAGCDRYTGRNGPDCNDADPLYQVDCGAPSPTGVDCLDDNVEVRCFASAAGPGTALAFDPFADEIVGQLLAGEQDWYALALPAGCELEFELEPFEQAAAASIALQIYSAEGELLHGALGSQLKLAYTAGSADEQLLVAVDELNDRFVEYMLRANPRCTAPGLKVAFFGDLSLSAGAADVLGMIAREQVDLVVHLGDIDYTDDPAAWDELVGSSLGSVPYLTVIGNHDVPMWYPAAAGAPSYQAIVQRQHGSIRGLRCEGEQGVNAKCRYRGLVLVESAIGTLPASPDDAELVTALGDALAEEPALWRICAWHKNQRDMQLGGKADEVGWQAYAACAQGGALIMTGHEHSYARSLTLTDFGSAAVDRSFGMQGSVESVAVGPNKTVVAVAGLGGHSLRTYDDALHGPEIPAWWATAYTTNRYRKLGTEVAEFTAQFGALFIDFGLNGDVRRAAGTFKTVDGTVIDEFEIERTE
jgi:Putative metal-binding motif/Calcineurin-like phosphoesterase